LQRLFGFICILFLAAVLGGCGDHSDSPNTTEDSTEAINSMEEELQERFTEITVAGIPYLLDENGNVYDSGTKESLSFEGGVQHVLFDGKYMITNTGDLLLRQASASAGTLVRSDYETILEDVRSFKSAGESILLYTEDFSNQSALYSVGKNPNGELGNGMKGDEATAPYLLFEDIAVNEEQESTYDIGNGVFKAAAIKDGELYVWGNDHFLTPTKYPWGSRYIESLKIVPDGVEITDLDGAVTLVNEEAMSPLTYKAEDIVWDATRGNSSGNIVNGGYFSESNGTVYFSFFGLARYVPGSDSFEVIRREEKKVSDIHVIDDKVTYIYSSNDLFSRERMGYLRQYPRKDNLGSNSSERSLNVFKDEIYWIEHLNSEIYDTVKGNESIRLTDTDGKTIISREVIDTVWNVWMDKKSDSIFYTLHNNVYRSDFDGKNPQKLVDGVYKYQYADGWIYFDREGTLTRYEVATGAEEQVMSLKDVNAYNVNGAFVYYILDDNVFRKALGTAEEGKQLNVDGMSVSGQLEDLHVLPSGLYFYDDISIYRLDFEGHVTQIRDLEHTYLEDKK